MRCFGFLSESIAKNHMRLTLIGRLSSSKDRHMDVFDTILRWVVMPIGGFVWLMFMRQQDHATQIAVLRTESDMARQAHDREIKEIKDKLDKILEKLDEKADKK